MSELFYINHDVVPIVIHGQTYHVRQFLMKEIETFITFASVIKPVINDEMDDKQLLEIFTQQLSACKGLIELLTNLPDIDQFITQHIDAIPVVLRAVMQANQAYFEQEDQHNDNKTELTWFDVLQALISAGHSQQSILEMSYGSYLGYLDAIQKQHKHQRIEAAMITRLAYHGGQDDFQKIMV